MRYPKDFAVSAMAFMNVANDHLEGIPGITRSQVEAYSTAGVMQMLNSGKDFVLDNGSAELDQPTVPLEVRNAASSFAMATAAAEAECGNTVSLTQSKARLRSSIFSGITDPYFMTGFFADPRSLDLLDTSSVILVASMSGGPFGELPPEYWDWLFMFLDANPETLTALATEYPDLVLEGLKQSPSLLPLAECDLWVESLAAGYATAGPAEREGILSLYADEMEHLSLGPFRPQ